MKIRSKKTDTSATCKALVVLCGILSLAGCQTPTLETMLPDARSSAPDARVTLFPGDELDIRFFYTPELNDVQRIRADGKITLQLLGEVKAAGMTPSELQQTLEKQYTGLIEKPSVAVIVRALNHRNVYIAGAVHDPGLIEMPGHTTVLAAIMQAGGFDMREANLENVLVIRHENGERKTFTLDFKEALSGGMPGNPFYLHAQDIVYVQRTGIVKTAQWIDQHISQLVPQTGLLYIYESGNHRVGIDTDND